jgi:hypothetical protein
VPLRPHFVKRGPAPVLLIGPTHIARSPPAPRILEYEEHVRYINSTDPATDKCVPAVRSELGEVFILVTRLNSEQATCEGGAINNDDLQTFKSWDGSPSACQLEFKRVADGGAIGVMSGCPASRARRAGDSGTGQAVPAGSMAGRVKAPDGPFEVLPRPLAPRPTNGLAA